MSQICQNIQILKLIVMETVFWGYCVCPRYVLDWNSIMVKNQINCTNCKPKYCEYNFLYPTLPGRVTSFSSKYIQLEYKGFIIILSILTTALFNTFDNTFWIDFSGQTQNDEKSSAGNSILVLLCQQSLSWFHLVSFSTFNSYDVILAITKYFKFVAILTN